MKENYQTTIADAKTIRELVLLETRNLLEEEIQKSVCEKLYDDVLPDDEEIEILDDELEDQETMSYIHRTAKKYDEEIEDDEYEDELEDDYEEKEETFDLESVVEQLEDDEDEIDAQKLAYMAAQSELRRQKDDDEYDYEEQYDGEEEDEDEDDPFTSEERANEAARRWRKSREYKPPFSELRQVWTGGKDIKIGNEDRKRLLLHAGLISKDRLHLIEYNTPMAVELKKRAGLHETDPQYLAKQMICEWQENDEERQLLID